MTDNNNDERQPLTGGDTTFISSTTGIARTFLPGDLVDNSYRLTSLVGRGGMGIVFACRHEVLHRDYAIKVFNGDQLSSNHWSRFQAEAKALAKLNHPGIVAVHNMGVDAGQYPYYVMDLLAGQGLDSLIKTKRRLPVNEALDYFIQVSDALISAHSQGIIHRDIKPSNMMLVRDDKNEKTAVKLVDFGIARLPKQGFEIQSQTAPGMIFGTPYYMSPEQCQGLRVDERSDIYSLGCALFESLTGRPPFRGDNTFHTFMLHQTEPPPSLASAAPGAEFSQYLQSAVSKMLAKDVSERYQTMAQVKHDLERIKLGKPIMHQGQVSTTAPGQSENGAGSNQRYSQTTPGEDDKPETGDQRPSFSITRIATIVGCLLLLLVVPGYFLLKTWIQGNGPATAKHTSPSSPDRDNSAGSDTATTEESPIDRFLQDERLLKPRMDKYIAYCKTNPSLFRRPGTKTGFSFPPDFIIGAIKIDQDPPLEAAGFVPVPAGKPVCMYLNCFCRNWPEVLDKFAADDLTGLEIETDIPDKVIAKISGWKKLSELSFFNTLILAADRFESEYDESALENRHLPEIDKIVDLRSLGLCGPDITGYAIAKMQLLDKLKTLKLKRIFKLMPLLHALETKNNITELWLVECATEDENLEPLTRMKNLETLHLRRSKLTSGSIEYFKRMHSLKHLIIGQDFSREDLALIRKALPFVKTEPIMDYTYWKVFPDKK